MKEELTKLPKIVLSTDPIMPAGRSFDAMGKTATVENAKSASDWVDIKGTKVSGVDNNNENDSSSATSIAERRRQRRNNNIK